ncbi:hypothetical protein Tco_1008786 [Tanacetum coccineum]
MSSTGSMLIANGDDCLDGCVGAGGGEVNGGGVVLCVFKSSLREISYAIEKIGDGLEGRSITLSKGYCPLMRKGTVCLMKTEKRKKIMEGEGNAKRC